MCMECSGSLHVQLLQYYAVLLFRLLNATIRFAGPRIGLPMDGIAINIDHQLEQP